MVLALHKMATGKARPDSWEVKKSRPGTHKTQGTEDETYADPKVVMELFQKKFLDN